MAVISYGLWQRRFGGAPDVIGAQLQGQLASFEIIGVMPPGFSYPVDTYVLERQRAYRRLGAVRLPQRRPRPRKQLRL